MEDEIENIEFIKKIIDKLKSMKAKDWTHTLVVYFMIAMLCLVFFVLGYAHATKNTVAVANEIIIQLIDKNINNINIYDNMPVVANGFMFNITNKKLTKMGD